MPAQVVASEWLLSYASVRSGRVGNNGVQRKGIELVLYLYAALHFAGINCDVCEGNLVLSAGSQQWIFINWLLVDLCV